MTMAPTYEVRRVVRASPKRLFDSWLDSREHTAITGANAEIGASADQAFSLLDGHVTGMNLKVEPYHRVLQQWLATSGVAATASPSRVELVLHTGANYGGIGCPHGDGTTVTVRHWHLPAEQTDYGPQWWEDTYFKRMDRYFAMGDNRFTRPQSP